VNVEPVNHSMRVCVTPYSYTDIFIVGGAGFACVSDKLDTAPGCSHTAPHRSVFTEQGTRSKSCESTSRKYY
jgi:hypothetical protein